MAVELPIFGRERNVVVEPAGNACLVHHRLIKHQHLQEAGEVIHRPIHQMQRQAAGSWRGTEPGEVPFRLRRRQLLSRLSNRQHICRKIPLLVVDFNLIPVLQQLSENGPELHEIRRARLVRYRMDIVSIALHPPRPINDLFGLHAIRSINQVRQRSIADDNVTPIHGKPCRPGAPEGFGLIVATSNDGSASAAIGVSGLGASGIPTRSPAWRARG